MNTYRYFLLMPEHTSILKIMTFQLHHTRVLFPNSHFFSHLQQCCSTYMYYVYVRVHIMWTAFINTLTCQCNTYLDLKESWTKGGPFVYDFEEFYFGIFLWNTRISIVNTHNSLKITNIHNSIITSC